MSDTGPQFASPLGVAASDVTVVCDYIGGGFGSKFQADPWSVAAARLAKSTGRPVKLMLDRDLELKTAGNRPSGFLKAKIGEDVPPYIILGACNPPLAHRAIAANPEVGMLLPCNVVVRETPGGGVVVEAMDPVAAMGIVQDEAVKAVAQEARDGIAKALEAL